jgi:hypothetical protein
MNNKQLFVTSNEEFESGGGYDAVIAGLVTIVPTGPATSTIPVIRDLPNASIISRIVTMLRYRIMYS